MKQDEGVSSVVGTVLLLVIVVIAAGLGTAAVISSIDSGSSYKPVVFFEESANENALYHAGGEALLRDDIRIFSGSIDITGKTRIDGKEWDIWKTGDLLTLGDNHPASSITILYKNRDILY